MCSVAVLDHKEDMKVVSEDNRISYLIFVISFTQAGFLNPNILYPKITKNTQILRQIAPRSVKYAVFRVQSGKFYTG